MMRWYLPLAVCAALAGHVEAELVVARAPACPSFETVVMPDAGARVPTNAKIWVLGDKAGRYVLSGGTEVVSFDIPGTLREYAVHSVAPVLVPGSFELRSGDKVVRLTVEPGIDQVPPRPPIVTNARADVSRSQVGSVVGQLRADITAVDAILVELQVEGGSGAPMLDVPGPVELHGACGGFDLPRPGTTCFTARSIDIAGNRSEPTRTCVDVAIPREADDESGTPFVALLVVAVFALIALNLPMYRSPKTRRIEEAAFRSGVVVPSDMLGRTAHRRRLVAILLAFALGTAAAGAYASGAMIMVPGAFATLALHAAGHAIAYSRLIALVARARVVVHHGDGKLVAAEADVVRGGVSAPSS